MSNILKSLYIKFSPSYDLKRLFSKAPEGNLTASHKARKVALGGSRGQAKWLAEGAFQRAWWGLKGRDVGWGDLMWDDGKWSHSGLQIRGEV